MNSRNNIVTLGLLLFTFILWSNAFIAIGMLSQKLTPMELLLARFAPVGLISAILVALFFRSEFMHLVRNHPVRLILMCIFEIYGYNLAVNHGQSYINPNAASLLITFNPLFTMLLAVPLLGEKLTFRRVAGTILAFIGLIVVIVLGKVGVSESILIPWDKIPYALILIMGPFSWALFTVIAKPISQDYSPAGLNFSILAIACLPMFLGFDDELIDKLTFFEAIDWFYLAFLAIGCTLITFWLWLVGVQRLKASNVSLFVFLNPPLTAIFSFLFFDKQISGWFFAGGLIMLMGITLAVAKDVMGLKKH